MKAARIAVFGGSFNPPGLHHLEIVKVLQKHFTAIYLIPCGMRPDKISGNNIKPSHRECLVRLAFGGLPKVKLKLFDLYNSDFIRTEKLQEMFQADGELWHVVGSDWILGGSNGKSQIQLSWQSGQRLWNQLNFAVVLRQGFEISQKDLPPRSIELEIPMTVCSASSKIREVIAQGQPFEKMVLPEVAKYINDNKLY